MKKILLLTISIFLLFFYACKKEENIPPVCIILNPENNAVYQIGDSIEIDVEASDPDGTKRYRGAMDMEIRLFLDGKGMASTREFPYKMYLKTGGLVPGTYTIKVVAIDIEGLEGSDEKQIVIETTVPVVETIDPAEIKLFSAYVGGTLLSSGGQSVTETGIYWGTSPGTEAEGSKLILNPLKGQFSTTLSGLPPDDTIYYRAFATNQNGESLGMEKSFVTLGKNMVPTCTILSPDNNAVIGKGETVTIRVDASDPDGNNIELKLLVNHKGISSTRTYPYIFYWSTEGYETGFHEIQVVAIDDQGLSSGDMKQVVIDVRTPIVKTLDATNLALTSARVTGQIISDGGASVAEAGIYWSSSPDPESTGQKIRCEIRDNNFFTGLSGLATNTIYYYKAYAINAIGESLGEEKAFKTYGNQTGTFVDSRDSRVYKWVIIGNQMWMAENLAHLPAVSPSETGSISDKRYYVYDYEGTDTAAAKATDNYKMYGALYNWKASLDACPSGWHVPTDEEWKELEKALGMSVLDAGNGGWRGTYEGRYMKAGEGWHEDGNGNNISDFNGIPAGYRLSYGLYDFIGKYSNWWTSSDYTTTNSWYRSLYYKNSGVFRNNSPRDQGFSVRCLKD